MDLKGKRVEVYFLTDIPKLEGEVSEEALQGLFVRVDDEGTNIQSKIVETFVPYASIKRADIMMARSPEEQEQKKHELADRFRRMALEATAPSTSHADMLAKEDDA